MQFYLSLFLILAFPLSGLYFKLVLRPQLGEDLVDRLMDRATQNHVLFIALLILETSLIESPKGTS